MALTIQSRQEQNPAPLTQIHVNIVSSLRHWGVQVQGPADIIPSWHPSMGLPGFECNGKLTK